MNKPEKLRSGMYMDSMVEVDAPPFGYDRILSKTGEMVRVMWDKHTARCTIERAGGRLEITVSRFAHFYGTKETYYTISVPNHCICLETHNPHAVSYKLSEGNLSKVDAETAQMAVSELVRMMDWAKEQEQSE